MTAIAQPENFQGHESQPGNGAVNPGPPPRASICGTVGLRVVHLVLTLNVGGLEKFVYDLVRYADRDTLSLRVLCLGEVGALGPDFEKIGVAVESLDVHGKGIIRGILAVARRLRELRPDVLHTHNPTAHLLGAPAAWLGLVPVTVHTKHGRNYPHIKRLVVANRVASWLSNKVIPVSGDSAFFAQNTEKVPEGKIEVIRNGIDLNLFHCRDRHDGSAVRRAIHVARLIYPTKDQRTLLRAVRLVADAEPNFVLDIVGDGPDRAHLEGLCDELQLRQHVNFLGLRDDVHELLAHADFFVLSSETEGLSISILEAMASGLPVVATDVGGNCEVVAQGQTGLLVPPFSPEALGAAMLELVRDPGRARKMGIAGRRRVEEQFDIRRVAARYEQLYRSLLKHNWVVTRSASLSARHQRSADPPSSAERPTLTERLFGRAVIPAFESIFKRRQTFTHWRRLEESQWLSTDELRARQLALLQKLLEQTAANCPYYRDAWQSLGLEPQRVQSLDDLQKWPLISRDTIRAHRFEMRTISSGAHFIRKATGGSSGVPLEFDIDMESYERKFGAWFRGYGWAGAAPGTKQWWLWGGPTGKQSTWDIVKEAFYHQIYRRSMMNSFHMNDRNIAWYLDQLNAARPRCIVAYTNPLYTFARSIEEQGLHPFSPRSIIVGAERLHDFQRELIERVFGAPVFETYGSREFMLIGGECEHHNGLHITMENLLLEIVGDEGQHTPPGQEGNVAITDLTNKSMPFIRYLNGDRAIAGFEQCPCGRGLPLLKRVLGRRLDMLETLDGRQVPGEFFPHLIKDFASIRRFQVIQDESAKIQVCLVVNRDWRDEDLNALEQKIRVVVGDVAHLEIAVVDNIPLTPAGKLRVVIRNFSSDGVDLLAHSAARVK